MATRKFLFVDTNGDYLESEGAFEVVDFVDESAGAGDAGKPIILDAAGKLDASFIDFGAIDHGGLSGLGDDDHTQYILVNGTRAFTGPQSMGSFKITNLAIGTNPSDAVRKSQLDQAVSGLQDFRESVINVALLTPPGSPSTGDRYLVGQPTDTATGDWVGFEGRILEWDGAAWVEDIQGTPDLGTFLFSEVQNSAFIFNSNTFASGEWVKFANVTVTAGNGIQILDGEVSVNLATNSGLEFVGTDLSVDFADTATQMGTIRAVAASDLSANGANQGAKILGADPALISFSSATNIQGVLEDLDAAIIDSNLPGVLYNAGAGGIAKGTLVAVSAANTVLAKDISDANYAIGVAMETVAATEEVKISAENAVCTGVLTGATPGDRYFWTGSALSTTIPAGGGSYVWLVGIAKNSTDLDLNVQFIKRNSL